MAQAAPNPFQPLLGTQPNLGFTKAALAVSHRAGKAAPKARPGVRKGVQGCNNLSKPETSADAQAQDDGPRLKSEFHRIPCPHCESPATIRRSNQVTNLTREYAFACTNFECGHTFSATMEITRTLSPSATPNPTVRLPLSTHVRRDLMREQLACAQPSDYRTTQTAPSTLELFGTSPPAD
ncbi:ogr/Delta-like zinc finger family protein [Delftia acidovorans]|uniref:ogr/Delta-like zinc finger family protein n=1 Tax=Delftia acidovorans TaxID=80866 RepID=UPI002FDEBFE7